MANITYTITQDGDEISYTINDGVGPVGPAGPNNITTSTETDITGILKGDGANVSAAVEDTDYQGVPAEGAFVDGDKTKLDGIEAGATADQTGAEIKSLYEAEADTNAFTDAEKSKLAGIEAGADVTDATNVDAAGAVMESDYSPSHSVLAQQSGTGSPSAVTLGTDSLLGRASGAGTAIQGLTAAQARTLLNVEDGATADQTAAEILTAIKTVDGTGSGLDADLLDGQEATAFATSAQGSLADSAVQPGDIDTLAELNAIITDATLIDTTDSRLSDARTPTAHTHTASDLDFAGSTDIGADLADADEVLVSDGGGNTTRVKSALSRFWTYIKAKIESVGLSSLNITGNLTVGSGTWDGATIAGNQTFSGQVEMTGQAASTDDSAMTRSLGDARYGQTQIVRKSSSEQKTNDATPSADSELSLPVEANSEYQIELCLAYLCDGGTTTQGLQLQFGGPTGWVMESVLDVAVSNAWQLTGRRMQATSNFGVAAGSTSAEANFRVIGTLTTSSTSGTIDVEWAQNTSSANRTQVRAGAFLKLTKIS